MSLMLSYARNNPQHPGRIALAETASANKTRRRLYWLLLTVGLILLALLIAKIGPTRMLDAWRQSDKALLLAGFCLFTFALFIRGLKWRLFLAVTPYPVAFINAVRAYVLNAFFANLTPARTGEVFAPVWLGRHGVPTAAGYALVVVDRMLDVVAVLTLFVLAVWRLGSIAPLESTTYRTGGWILSMLVTCGLVVLIIALLRLDRAIAWLAKFQGRIGTKIRHALDAFREALIPYQHRGVVTTNLGLTFATWLMDLTTSFLVVRSVLPGLTWLDSAVASMFATAAALASMIPGGIGIGAMGYTAVLALLGYDPTLAGAGAVLMTVMTHLIRAVLSGLFSFRASSVKQ